MGTLRLKDGVWQLVDEFENPWQDASGLPRTKVVSVGGFDAPPVHDGERHHGGFFHEHVIFLNGIRYAIAPSGSAYTMLNLTGSGPGGSTATAGGGKSLSSNTGSTGTVAIGDASP